MKKATRRTAKKAAKKTAGFGGTRSYYELPQDTGELCTYAVPTSTLVEPGKLQKGLGKAKDEITDLIQEIVDGSTHPYEITEIEFAASFSADGKFMGFGVGGAATITFRIRPSDQA